MNPTLFAFPLGIGILLVFYGVARYVSNKNDVLGDLETTATYRPRTFQEARMNQTFHERVTGPLASRLAGVVGGQTPRAQQEAIGKKLLKAGRPYELTVENFLAAKGVAALISYVIGVVLILLLKPSLPFLPPIIYAAIGAILVGALGYFLPDVWLRGRVKARMGKILHQLPHVLDLLSVCADAGLTFDAGLARLVDNKYLTGPLVDELANVLRDVRLGLPRAEALTKMSDSLDIMGINSFVSALNQSDKTGVSIAQVLKEQASEARRQARAKAEEKVALAGLKMLFPLVGCIFPTILIVLLTPAVIQVLDGGK